MANHIYLPQDERNKLEQRIKSGKHAARVLLLLDRSQGHARTLAEVAEAALVSVSDVNAIKRRYLAGGWQRAGLEQARPGRPVAKMEDGLAVYQRPYDARYPVICRDEIERALRSTPRGGLEVQPGRPRRADYE